jgi:hypothetical protein
MALVALNTLFFSLAAGICMSSMCRVAQRASGLTLAYLLFFSVLLPALAAMLTEWGTTKRMPIGLLLTSPGFAYYLAWDTWYRVTPPAFWFALLVQHAMAWSTLALASVIAPRSWQDKPAGVQRLAWRERVRLWTLGNACQRTEFRQRLLQKNPFFWLASRARLKPAAVWSVLFLLACGWAWGLLKFRRDWLNEGVFLFTGLALSLLLRSWLANEASRQLAEDRKAGTLELLLSSPLSVAEILHGQWLAVLRQFLGPLIAVLFVDCLLMRATLAGFMVQDDRIFWTSLWVAGMLMLVADLLALYWVGMWQGLTERNPARAAGSTLARILVVPWLGFAVVMLMLVLSTAFDNNRTAPGPTWRFFLGLWFLFGLLTDVGFAAHARYKLLTGFRFAAQQRFSPSQGFWARIFRTEPPPAGGPYP